MKVTLPSRRKSRIEMLPLIDIVFLLLVVFIYAMLSMAVHRGMPLALPTSAETEIEKNLMLSVSIDRSGMVYLDREPMKLEELTAVLKSRAEGQDNPGVLLFADRQVDYEDLFSVLDRIKLAGLHRISLQAEGNE